MRRIKDENGVVHYGCPATRAATLCGKPAGIVVTDIVTDKDTLFKALQETTERVTCPNCAKVVCAVRNEPYNTLVADIDGPAFYTGIVTASQADGPAETTKGE